MRRREFIALASAAAAFPRAALAQAKVPRIAYLAGTTAVDYWLAFLQGLSDLGYTEGRNVVIDRYVSASDSQVPTDVARAVATRPDLIVALSSPAPLALKALGTPIPVVFTSIQDPVAIGLVSSYARPGGNFTGTMTGSLDLVRKQIEILSETVSPLRRMVFFAQPDDPPYPVIKRQVDAAGTALGIDITTIEIKEGEDVVEPVVRAQKMGAQAVYPMTVTYFISNMPAMAGAALALRLPIGGHAVYARAGALVGYAANLLEVVRRSATYVDAILKGAKPADMAVEQPSKFDFVVNLKTAKTLGIAFPQSILLGATEVIQ